MFKFLVTLITLNYFFSGLLLANPLDYRFQEAYRVQSLSIDEGLSQSVVQNMIQDSEGYIWVTTEDGLNRFDGYEFKVYEHQHSNLDSLHENSVISILEDPGLGFWIGTLNGLSFFDPVTESFVNHSSKTGTVTSKVRALTFIGNNSILIGMGNGLFVLNKSTGVIELFTSESGQSIVEDVRSFDTTETHIWIVTRGNVYSIEKSTQSLMNFRHPTLTKLLSKGLLTRVKFHNNHLWLSSTSGLIDIDLITKQSAFYLKDKNNLNSLSSNYIQALQFDQEGNLWIGTDDGLDYLRIDEGIFEHYRYLAHENEGLSANDIMSLMIDSSGLLWVGTFTGGLNILDPKKNQFKHIITKSELAEFGVNNTINGIVKDNNENLWFANLAGGTFKLDLMSGEISQPLHEEITSIDSGLKASYSLLIDQHNRLWNGTINGLVMINLDDESLFNTKIYIDGELSKFNIFVVAIYEDYKGDIWLGTSNGLFQVKDINESTKDLTIHLINKNNEIPHSFLSKNNTIWTMLETRDGNLWMGGRSGLLLYSKKNSKWSHFEHQLDNPQSITNDYIQVLYEDSRGILWVGTANGLNKVSRKSDEDIYFDRITKEQGLPHNAIYGMSEDKYKQIWISTSLGLVRYSENFNNMKSFTKNDGISSNEYNTGASFSDNEGVVYFGSINGITIIDSRVITKTAREHRLKLTNVSVGQRELDIYQLNHSAEPLIERQKNEAVTKISVADLYYRRLGTQSYRYRLLGLSDSWVNLGKQRQINIAGLLEGNYLLEVQSKVGDEDWPLEKLRLRLNVQEEFWNSRNAVYLGASCLLLLFIFIVYLIRRNYLAHVQKMENRIRVESIRMKASKKENTELKSELNLRLNEISQKNNTINESSKQLLSQQFRDPVTGFYRFDNIKMLLNDSVNGNGAVQYFSLIMVIQLSSQKEIRKEYGPVCAAEACAYVAEAIRKITPGYTYLCSLGDDAVIILGNSVDHEELTETLLNVRRQIQLSQIPVANDISIKTDVCVSYLDICPGKITDQKLLIKLAENLIVLHKTNNLLSKPSLMQIDLNENIEFYKETELDVTELLASDCVTLQFL